MFGGRVVDTQFHKLSPVVINFSKYVYADRYNLPTRRKNPDNHSRNDGLYSVYSFGFFNQFQ